MGQKTSVDWGANTAGAVPPQQDTKTAGAAPTQESFISVSADEQGNFMSSIMIAVTVITVTAFLLWYHKRRPVERTEEKELSEVGVQCTLHCILPKQVLTTRTGECYHTQSNCYGLRSASETQSWRLCKLCNEVAANAER
eukprot:3776763-Amphidinium_carterae.1